MRENVEERFPQAVDVGRIAFDRGPCKSGLLTAADNGMKITISARTASVG